MGPASIVPEGGVTWDGPVGRGARVVQGSPNPRHDSTCDPLLRSGPRTPNGAALNNKGPGQTTFASPAGAATSRQLPRRNGTQVAREISRSRAASRAPQFVTDPLPGNRRVGEA